MLDHTTHYIDQIKSITKNAVVYKAEILFNNVETVDEKTTAIKKLTETIGLINDDVKRELFIDELESTKHLNIKKGTLKKALNQHEKEKEKKQKEVYLKEGEQKLPPGVDRDEFHRYGFYEKVNGAATGYYFSISSKAVERFSNFVIKPLFHVYSKTDNKRLIEITNGFETKVLEMPSKSMISLDAFTASVYEEGFFLFEGSKQHLMKINSKIGNNFPICTELRTLGWQEKGFWAYANMTFKEELKRFDEYGIVEIDDKKYLSMAASKVYQDISSEEDIYENDRYLTYIESTIDFKEWARMMELVYEKNGWMGIAFSVTTLFRDHIFQVAKIPHLYAYGAVQAGKSEFGDSISNLFFHQMPAFNLNQGTDFAFYSRMERFRNCPNALNEFDENAIKEEWFRAIKGAYDGEGREKGRGGKEGKTKAQKINCTLVLMGQYLSTKDDNSVLSRCIPLPFRENNNRSDEQIRTFTKLKELEKQGLSSILVEVLRHRKDVVKNFAIEFSALRKKLTEELIESGKQVKSRILSNYCVPLTCVKILSDKLSFPFSYQEFFEFVKQQLIEVNQLISESNAINDFWKTVEFLLDRGIIEDGSDFKIEVKSDVKVIIDRDTKRTIEFNEPKKVLFIRISNVHKLYSEAQRKQTGKNALNEQTLLMYLREQKYYIGMNPGSNFKSKEGKITSTSSFMFDYDKLNIALERFESDKAEVKSTTIEGRVINSPEVIEVLGVPKVSFKILLEEYYDHEGVQVKKQTYTNCFMNDLQAVNAIQKDVNYKLTGNLVEINKTHRDGRPFTSRNMDVVAFEISVQSAAELIPPTNNQKDLEF